MKMEGTFLLPATVQKSIQSSDWVVELRYRVPANTPALLNFSPETCESTIDNLPLILHVWSSYFMVLIFLRFILNIDMKYYFLKSQHLPGLYFSF